MMKPIARAGVQCFTLTANLIVTTITTLVYAEIPAK